MSLSIFVVGDVHGNYPKLVAALDAAGYKTGDRVIFVGDLTDRGSHNARVVRFVRDLGDKAHIVRGNHEYQHLLLLPLYQTILSFGKEYAISASFLFKYFKPGVSYPKTAAECAPFKCSLDERWNIISTNPKNFEEAIKRFAVQILAWEDDAMWKMVIGLLDSMCGPPYDAEHTLYEYFSGTTQTRATFEAVWRNPCQEINIDLSNSKYKHVVITHNNPFGPHIDSHDTQVGEGHENTLYIFGHIPVDVITESIDTDSNCKYIDIDLSPKSVGVVCLGKEVQNAPED